MRDSISPVHLRLACETLCSIGHFYATGHQPLCDAVLRVCHLEAGNQHISRNRHGARAWRHRK